MTGKNVKAKVTSILFIIMVVTFLTGGMVFAEEPQFRLDIDSVNLQKGVSANLVLSMINAQNAESVDIMGLKNFDVLSSSQSTSTRIINGDATYQKDIYYVIMPHTTGQFTLRGTVQYNGSTYKTNELEINVSEASDIEKGEAQDLFIKTLITEDELYFGQKVVLTYELYSRYNIENFGFLDDVNIDGFILNDIPRDKLKANYTYIEGNKYVKYEAKQTYLSPIKTGTFKIPAYNFQVNVSTGDFFNSSKPFYLKTKSKELTVKPLPLDNQPADFSGIVGKLNLDASYSRQEVDYGDSLALKVTASGNCNLERLDKIIEDELDGFSVYETEKNMEESIQNNQYKAQKEFEVILVPEKSGDISIDPLYISYFNPETGRYEKAEIPGTTIKVNGEMPQVQKQVQNGTTAVETVRIDQVNYSLQNEGYLIIKLKKDQLLIILVAFIILLILSAVAYMLFSYKKKQDKELKDIYRKIKNSNNQNEIYNLFNDMIKHCFNLSLKASSRSIIVSRLESYDIATSVIEIMDYMENGKQKGEIDHLKGKIKEIYKKL